MRTKLTMPAILAVVALGASAPGAGAAVTSPTSGWFWGNPTPQGSTLAEIGFVGARGYAVGIAGAAVRTDDGGATWSGLRTGLVANLTHVSVPNPETVVLGGGCAGRRSTDGGASFQRLTFTSSDARCRSNLAGLSFPTPDAGVVVTADGNVQATADGGRSFAARTAIPATQAAGGSERPTALLFTSPTNGFALTEGGKIHQTTDGGTNWTQRHSRVGSFRALTFADATTAYAVGSGSGMYASTDAGVTWTQAPVSGAPPGLTLDGVACSSATTCVAVTEDGRQLLRTGDGWNTVAAFSSATQPLFAAGFAGPTRVVAVGSNGTTRVSDDAGASFAPVGGTLGVDFARVRRGPDANTAYAAGSDGRIGVTADGGNTWTLINANTPDDVRDVAFPTTAIGYEVDVDGLLKKTVNGGTSWSDLDTGSRHANAILAPTPTSVLLLGPRGILRSTNGVDFNPVAGRAVNRASLFDGDRAGGALFAFGTTALLASTNGGRTWVAVRKPGPRLRIFDIDFVTPSTGYLLDSASRLYRTTNRGRRWTEIVTLGTDDAFDLAFSSRSSGWVATSALGDGTVFRTSDGGRSFSPQRIDLEGVVTADDSNGLTALGPNAGIAITGSDAAHGRAFTSLFATATGGQAGTPSALTLSAIPRRLRRAGTVRVRGRLRPAEGGETVTVARFDLRRGRWETQEARVASNGSFTTTWRLSRSAAFVANWRGDDDRAGDGSRALVVRVGRR